MNHEISKLVPHLWVKVIYNPTRNLAAVIYIHNSTIDYQDEKQCKDEKLCDFQEWAKDMTASNLLHQQAYCCAIDETSWLINVLPYDMKVDGFLNINQLQLPDTPEKWELIDVNIFINLTASFNCKNFKFLWSLKYRQIQTFAPWKIHLCFNT